MSPINFDLEFNQLKIRLEGFSYELECYMTDMPGLYYNNHNLEMLDRVQWALRTLEMENHNE